MNNSVQLPSSKLGYAHDDVNVRPLLGKKQLHKSEEFENGYNNDDDEDYSFDSDSLDSTMLSETAPLINDRRKVVNHKLKKSASSVREI